MPAVTPLQQVIVPAAGKSVITATSKTTFKVGTYTALTDAFTSVVDLNDRVSFWLDTVDLGQPPKADSRSFSLRTPGERLVAWQYKNRHIKVSVHLLYQNGTATLFASLRALLAAAEQPPYRLAFAPPNHTVLTYADVVGVTHTIPYDAKQIINGALTKIAIDFECLPGLAGDRIWLQNLVVNPGFEAPGGAPVSVFNDTFVNTNDFITVGGAGGPSVGTAGAAYATVVTNDLPYHYYRMADTNTTCLDTRSAGNGTYTGTAGTSYIQNLGGGLCSDANAACFFNGASGYVNGSATGLQTANGGWTVEAWILPQAWPSAGGTAFIAGWGNGATKSTPLLFVNSSGQIFATGTAWGDTGGASMTLNAWHHVVGTWDGTTLRCYLDGVQVGTPTTPGAMTITATTFFIAAGVSGGSYFNGRVDEVAFYNGALSASQILTHYNAAYANALVIPTGGGVKFGSPAWSSINNWQVRFRYATSQTLYFSLHYTDANNILRVAVSNTTASLQQVTAGATSTLASTSVTLTPGNWYWLRATQFPGSTDGSATLPQVQALLYNDSSGGIGAQIGSTLGPVALGNTTAMSGYMEMESGNNERLVVGGAFSGTLLVQLFGPGGWGFTTNNNLAATGFTAAAWEQNSANTYAAGPVVSNACARMDLPPAGTVNAYWESYSGGTPGGSSACPVTSGQTVAASLYVRSSGMASTMSTQLLLREWDTNGNLLRGTTLATLSGTQSNWTQMSGTLVMGTSTVYCSLLLLLSDAAVGTSASGTLWMDNAQMWNQSTTGQSVMPYCELRFPQSPAQLVLGSTQGDMVAPGFLALGTYRSVGASKSIYATLGRLLTPNPAATLVGQAILDNSVAPQSLTASVLDSGSYGGWYWQVTSNQASGQAFSTQTQWISAPAANFVGSFHIYERFWCSQSNYAALSAQAWIPITTLEWETGPVISRRALYKGSYVYPLTAQNNWIDADAGLVTLPMYGQAALQDNRLSGYLTPQIAWNDPSDTLNGTYRHNWAALVPIDGGLLAVRLVNGTTTSSGNYWWCYADGLAVQQGGDASWHYSLESKATPNPAAGVGGIGVTSGNGSVSVNPSAESYLQIDPTQSVVNGTNTWRGINQYVGFITSDVTLGEVLPLYAEVQYTPLYLTARDQ